MNARKLTALFTASALILSVPAAFAGDHHDKHFKKLDADGDGKVTRAEHAQGAQKMFAKADGNGDGIVTAAEMDAIKASYGDKPAQTQLSAAEKIRVIDQNGDGQLTAAEHTAGSEAMFAKADTDGDGVLSESECKAALKGMDKPSAQ